MPKLNMSGPYKLDNETIDKEVTKISPGNYALGKENKEGGLIIKYVGRADKDLNGRLKSWVDERSYTHFKYSYASSIKNAFEEECRNYHDWKNLDNDIHPDRPDGKDYKCPYCDIFE